MTITEATNVTTRDQLGLDVGCRRKFLLLGENLHRASDRRGELKGLAGYSDRIVADAVPGAP